MQFMTDRLKLLNSLKFFGALAECPELLKAFSRSIMVFTLSLSFVTLCRRFACRFNSPSIRRRCEQGINYLYIYAYDARFLRHIIYLSEFVNKSFLFPQTAEKYNFFIRKIMLFLLINIC